MSVAALWWLGADNGVAASAAIAPLVVRGQFFTLETGEPFTVMECSDFALFLRHLLGEDVRPIIDERLEVGFNLQRIWLLNTSVLGAVAPGGLTPQTHPELYDALPGFCELLTRQGSRGEFTAFTQPGSLMPRFVDQERHLDRVAAVLRAYPGIHLLELVNEYDAYPDSDSGVTSLPQPSGVVGSHGSGGAGSVPALSPWTYGLYHTNDLPEWPRKCAHNPMEKVANVIGRPAWANENTRPDRDPVVHHFEDAAAGAALLCAGSCFHSQEGKLSQRFGPSRLFAEAWVRGARSVPLEFQRGAYLHRQDLEGPDCSRAYERRLPDGRGYVVPIRP